MNASRLLRACIAKRIVRGIRVSLRTPCHILFLLRYIHESFLRFWLNANNSECFYLPTMLLEIRWKPLAHRNEIRFKGTKIIGKEKTFRGYYYQKIMILTLFL